MHVRLAFAVAAHLEPDILIVDEVLAVGDAEFQKKCLGKMGDAARSGRTVLFVSHNMAARREPLQPRDVARGRPLRRDGRAGEVTSRYLVDVATPRRTTGRWSDPGAAPGNEQVRIRRALVRPEDGSTADPIDVATPFRIEFEYWNLRENVAAEPQPAHL